MAATLNPAATPLLALGAPSPGGLRLPDASPSDRAIYAPRGVAILSGGGLAISDTGNHRVLIWKRLPTESHAPADLVLGQSAFDREGPQAGGEGPANGMHLPTGVLESNGALFVCDAWNHRVLVWDRVPEESSTPPDRVLGQPDLVATLKNRGAAIGRRGFDCPYGLALIGGDLHLADTQNRRVLVWDGVPSGDQAPARLLGQDDFETGDENRGRGPGPATFRWPHAFAGDGETLFVADAGNHRVLGWGPGVDRSGPADLLLGQERFDTAFELPHVPQGPSRLRFPYALASDARRLVVGDTANNRVLVFDRPTPSGASAVAVLGQHGFDTAGENRWGSIEPDTLCWPYGLALSGDLLAIADSGNNRITLWRLAGAANR